MKYTVAVIGAGHIGTALQSVLSSHHTVILWDKNASKVPHQKPLAEIASQADIVFIGTPSTALREALSSIAPFVKPEAVICTSSKGIEAGTLATMDRVLTETLKPGQLHAFIGGPMLAKEIMDGKYSMAACGTNNRKAFQILKRAFSKTALKLEYTADIRGVAVCGVLKNVYTLALGMAAGLELGNNTIGWLGARGFNEILTLMKILGGRKKTFLSTAGLGDFIATATSPHSMNYRAGEEIAKTGKLTILSEGVISLPSLTSLSGPLIHKLPLLTAVNNIITHHHDPKKTLTDFIKSAR